MCHCCWRTVLCWFQAYKLKLFSITNYYKILNSSLCHAVDPYGLSILYTLVCICKSQAFSVSSTSPFPFGISKFVFCVCRLFLFCK